MEAADLGEVRAPGFGCQDTDETARTPPSWHSSTVLPAGHPGVSHTVANGGSVSRTWPSSGLTGSRLITSLPP